LTQGNPTFILTKCVRGYYCQNQDDQD